MSSEKKKKKPAWKTLIAIFQQHITYKSVSNNGWIKIALRKLNGYFSAFD